MDAQGELRSLRSRWHKSSVSAINPDRKTVVMTIWRDEIVREADSVTWTVVPRPRGKRPSRGSKERMANLIWARDHCGGMFRVVITVKKADGKGIAYCFPDEKLVMRVTSLDEDTGAIRAESVT
jgi:hypothetical protein